MSELTPYSAPRPPSFGQIMQQVAAQRMLRNPEDAKDNSTGRSYFIADATVSIGGSMLDFNDRANSAATKLVTEMELPVDSPIVQRQFDTAEKVNSVLALVLDKLPAQM